MIEEIPVQADSVAYIKGEVNHIIFHNPENFYTVASLHVIQSSEELPEKSITIVGLLPTLEPHEVYLFEGVLHDHRRFGLQFQVHTFQRDIPRTMQGIIHFLSSDRFPGIGKKTAAQVVKTLGENAIQQILADRRVLEEVPKLPAEKADQLYSSLMEYQGIEQLITELAKHGFGVELTMKIYQTFKDEALEIIRTNPYKLIHHIEGIGFKRADLLGEAIGLSGNHPERIQAGCLFSLHEICMQEGHVFLYKEDLCREVISLLSAGSEQITKDEVETEILHLDEEDKIMIDGDAVYLASLYFAEKGIVTSINRIIKNKEKMDDYPESEFLKALGALEEKLNIEYAPTQKEAIQTAISSPFMILTGGPGTGKTTVIKGIVEVFAALHGHSLEPTDYKRDEPFPVLLVAPTGRAAKRMGEATGLPATTIHRLLGWKGGNGGFEKDEDQQLEGSLLIVDEVSMVDIWLANQLFKSIPNTMQVLLVGDQDQLPSVGPGQVLRDFLDSSVIPTIALTEIYRQAQGSSIIKLAHAINRGEVPEDLKTPQPDRSFFPCSQMQVQEVIEKVCSNAIQKGYSAKDIQVLAPMYRGTAGIEQLNERLQHLFNPKVEGKRELLFGDGAFRTGDMVLQLVNNPEEQVYNGDRGEIVSIFYAKENTEKKDQLVVSFDGIEVVYEKKDFNQLTHAYCTSIHKAQGSEFPIVILPVVMGYHRMLRRNLIYTGITRAKKFLILCGEMSAWQRATEHQGDELRNSSLANKLKQTVMETAD
ncbi:ATP-dependent RecD-like DNA helicase [Bacillus alkalicellulosilyticus]|uniref:SF1B family DNA helicase RecD2 n=1 Tax=Alkalihalobacterium alkalicellulosilyticum TaxID=1912214 RepID=UPI00099819C7|nr:ATP-dependent RecD-like DNA helicase [Bacillus alkalicellulosilyticus]